MLKTSIFSFSKNVFPSLRMKVIKTHDCDKELENSINFLFFHSNPISRLRKVLENFVGIGAMLVTSTCSFSNNVFYPFKNKFHYFIKNIHMQRHVKKISHIQNESVVLIGISHLKLPSFIHVNNKCTIKHPI